MAKINRDPSNLINQMQGTMRTQDTSNNVEVQNNVADAEVDGLQNDFELHQANQIDDGVGFVADIPVTGQGRAMGALGAFALEPMTGGDISDIRPGGYALPSGGSLQAFEGGGVLYEPANDMEATALENQGFTWAGESGMFSFPSKSGPEHLLSGGYDLPTGSMYIHMDGQFAFEPSNYDDVPALEAQGFRWAGETGMLEPPSAPGTYELPGGGQLMVRDDGELLYEPGNDMEAMALENQGFDWAGESGMVSFPKKDGPEHRLPGTYDLPSGDKLYVHVDGEIMFEPGNYDQVASLEEQGMAWAGESGMLSFPTE